MTGEVPFKVQALSGDIPAKGGHSWFIPEKKGRSVLPLREGVSPAHKPASAASAFEGQNVKVCPLPMVL
jgi:hypothetical protein